MKKPVIVLFALVVAAAGGVLWVYFAQSSGAGVVLDYELDFDAALHERAEDAADFFVSNPPWGDAQCAVRADGPQVSVQCPADVALDGALGDYTVHTLSPGRFEMRLSQAKINQFREDAQRAAIQVVKYRLGTLGATGTRVRRVGEKGVSIFIPGVNAGTLMPTHLGRVGRLRFQIVDGKGSPAFFAQIAARAESLAQWPAALDPDLQRHPIVATEDGVRSTSRAVLEYLVAGQSDLQHIVGVESIVVDPQDRELQRIWNLSPRYAQQLSSQTRPDLNADVTQAFRLVYMFRGRGMGGSQLEEASIGADEFNRPLVHLRFNPEGAKAFFELTRASVNEKIAIMVDDIVYSAPNIKEPIAGGRVQIEMVQSGERAFQEAEGMVAMLKSGTLMAPLRKVGARDVEHLDW